METTVSAPQLETFAAGVEIAVDVAQIERQLHELWQLAAESHKDPSQRQITRASLFNLVVVCGTDAELDRTNETIGTLTSLYPCRAIVLMARPDQPQAELSAAISAHCHLAGGERKQVCCEQIIVRATGRSVEHLNVSVLPLLESDLPTIIWWQGNFLLQIDLFRRLIAVADRLIYDTSSWIEPQTQLVALVRAIHEGPRCNFADLSWTRLGLWRRLAAEFFDESHCRAELNKIRAVEIVHGRGPGAGLRALLFGSWIAAQLNWPATEAKAKICLSERDDHDATSVGILSVAIKTDDAIFSIHKHYGEHAASAVVEMPSACSLPRKRAFWPTDDASLLSRELDHSTRHTVYERALTMAAQVIEPGFHKL